MTCRSRAYYVSAGQKSHNILVAIRLGIGLYLAAHKEASQQEGGQQFLILNGAGVDPNDKIGLFLHSAGVNLRNGGWKTLKVEFNTVLSNS